MSEVFFNTQREIRYLQAPCYVLYVPIATVIFLLVKITLYFQLLVPRI